MKLICRVVAFFFVLLCCSSLLASPACPGLFELRQPSGFDFRAQYVPGSDEYSHSIQTEDGYGIYKDENEKDWKYFVAQESRGKKIKNWGVKKDKDGVSPIVGEVNPLDLGIPKGLKQKVKKPFRSPKPFSVITKKISGDVKVVVVGVEFNNQSHTYSEEEVADVVFGNDGVGEYFKRVSYGKIDIVPAEETSGVINDGFVGWIHLDMDHPGNNFGSYNTIRQLVEICSESIDFPSFDKSGDGILETDELAIVIIVAGYDEAVFNTKNAIWGGLNDIGFDVDGVYIDSCVSVGEVHYDHLLTRGVIAHELGHLMLGLPDLYDNYSEGEEDWWGGLGYFCLMSSGAWGKKAKEEYYGSSPVHPSAWCKEQLGWGSLAVATATEEQNISFNRENSDDFNIIRMNTQNEGEYFLAELRRDEGFGVNDIEINGGIVVYHVDTQTFLTAGHWINVNNNPDNKGIDVEEAASDENEPSLDEESNIYESMFFKKGYDFTDETDPSSKTNDGESTFVSVTNVSEVGDVMTADVYIVYATPTPTPTPVPEEMTLLVSVNGVDAITNDNIVVDRGSRVTVSVRAETFDGFFWEDLQADKIVCEIKNSKGKVKLSEEQENTYEGSFSYKIKKKAPRGFYEGEVSVFKEGYTTSFQQVKFKVQ